MPAASGRSAHHGAFGNDRFGVLAERFARFFGTPRFIIMQTCLVAVWIAVNAVAASRSWDPYPFILLNLMFSVQAAYASPLILMAGNVAASRDRDLWEHDYKVNQEAYAKIEAIELRTQQMVEAMNKLVEEKMGSTSVGGNRQG